MPLQDKSACPLRYSCDARFRKKLSSLFRLQEHNHLPPPFVPLITHLSCFKNRQSISTGKYHFFIQQKNYFCTPNNLITMKKLLSAILIIIPSLLFAQQAKNLADTVITKDASNANGEYWIIHNFKGIMKSQGYMLNGKKEGAWREYSDGSGMISKIEEYKDGKKRGMTVTFTANGMIGSDETYMNDKLEGQRTVMNNGGRVKSVENYKNGIL